ncbi:MAG: hypothetical protein DWI23_00405 [Planctomycetota bacterium]|nr:MAG: hypothetical protein DWI23_00405 [Planctomycetota bacterium]
MVAAKKARQKEVAEHEKVVAENTRLKADKIAAEKAAAELAAKQASADKAAVDKAAAASAPTNTLGMEFVKISKGDFQMGSPASEAGRDSDETQVAVSFSEDFELGKTEVTQGQFKKVMGTLPWVGKKQGSDW